ncbi:hypothetical protein EYF80_046714 [Liparis tanakae]|uniref:Uncharacterized protein n=1 Tax=Liparis tanakae TaxID=230148 RepID=A0A4Z2FQA3_9TELE|nr:hypothetical protein EYF80_046714 [Liparis tanakae]
MLSHGQRITAPLPHSEAGPRHHGLSYQKAAGRSGGVEPSLSWRPVCRYRGRRPAGDRPMRNRPARSGVFLAGKVKLCLRESSGLRAVGGNRDGPDRQPPPPRPRAGSS